MLSRALKKYFFNADLRKSNADLCRLSSEVSATICVQSARICVQRKFFRNFFLIKKTYKIIIIFAVFLLNSSVSFAVDDGFGSAKKIEGKHFTIYYAPQLDVSSLAQQLNIGSADKILVGGKTIEKEFSSEAELSDMLDTLFLQAGDVLDMHLYSFHGTIKICKDNAQLNRIYNYFFDKDLKSNSFYSYSLNTVYACADNFTRGILSHEIAHAIISHYFVVQPSIKIQEVLAMYVEYQLRKIGR